MSATSHTKVNLSNLRSQRGAAFIVMIVVLVMGAATILVSSFGTATLQIERDKKTAEALAQAKEALIGYAVRVQVSNSNGCIPDCARPGDLPCPDINDNGTAESSCSGNALGRLPWKTLGLSELRDGSGEHLWYAVSAKFKKSPRTSCSSPGDVGCLNSDTNGTISVFASDGTQLNDGGGSTGAVAVIIAPGAVLQRQDGYQQDRSSTGVNTAKNYLDIATIGGNNEDNANFSDGSHSNGFIQGRIKDSNNNIIVNDQLLTISQDNIMQPIQKRVAGEVKLCLEDYASSNHGRYPWAAPVTDLTTNYDDSSNRYFGRIPNNLNNTRDDSGGTMNDQWGSCSTHFNNTSAGWWLNWKEIVFYGVARSFRPRSSSTPSFPSICSTSGNCLNVNDNSTPTKFVVIVAGKKLTTPDQTNRNSHKDNADYYLEGGNENADQSGGYTFKQDAPSTTFNDTLVHQ